ncbi:DUF6274 family protein [Streptomyces sp. NPDC101213]|uniref:DUF6274 family protein n=1 Tax=unclassified Streptomyces TaxID=2593676 RepID=UPI0036F9252B
MAASTGHETRALLRAHLSAASSYRHLTHRCPVCRRLQRLVADGAPTAAEEPPEEPPEAPSGTPREAGEGEQPYTA